MHPPLTNRTNPSELFTRERRRQRMKEFVQKFEQQAWTNLPEVHRLLPVEVPGCHAGSPGLAAQAVK